MPRRCPKCGCRTGTDSSFAFRRERPEWAIRPLNWLSQARLDLTKSVPQELYLARFEAETAKMKSLDSKAARDVLISIGDACYERLTRYAQAEIAAVNET